MTKEHAASFLHSFYMCVPIAEYSSARNRHSTGRTGFTPVQEADDYRP